MIFKKIIYVALCFCFCNACKANEKNIEESKLYNDGKSEAVIQGGDDVLKEDSSSSVGEIVELKQDENQLNLNSVKSEDGQVIEIKKEETLFETLQFKSGGEVTIVIEDELTFIEKDTGLAGWRYQEECTGGDGSVSYSIRNYAPPKHKDYADYAFFRITYGDKEITYAGYEFFPYDGRKTDCGINIFANKLFLNSYNYSASVKYIVVIDYINNKKSKLIINLKHGAYEEFFISNGVYFATGLGLCEVVDGTDYDYDKFCNKVRYSKIKQGNEIIGEMFPDRARPSFPGLGVFNIFMICDNCQYTEKDVFRSLEEHLLSEVEQYSQVIGAGKILLVSSIVQLFANEKIKNKLINAWKGEFNYFKYEKQLELYWQALE